MPTYTNAGAGQDNQPALQALLDDLYADYGGESAQRGEKVELPGGSPQVDYLINKYVRVPSFAWLAGDGPRRTVFTTGTREFPAFVVAHPSLWTGYPSGAPTLFISDATDGFNLKNWASVYVDLWEFLQDHPPPADGSFRVTVVMKWDGAGLSHVWGYGGELRATQTGAVELMLVVQADGTMRFTFTQQDGAFGAGAVVTKAVTAGVWYTVDCQVLADGTTSMTVNGSAGTVAYNTATGGVTPHWARRLCVGVLPGGGWPSGVSDEAHPGGGFVRTLTYYHGAGTNHAAGSTTFDLRNCEGPMVPWGSGNWLAMRTPADLGYQYFTGITGMTVVTPGYGAGRGLWTANTRTSEFSNLEFVGGSGLWVERNGFANEIHDIHASADNVGVMLSANVSLINCSGVRAFGGRCGIAVDNSYPAAVRSGWVNGQVEGGVGVVARTGFVTLDDVSVFDETGPGMAAMLLAYQTRLTVRGGVLARYAGTGPTVAVDASRVTLDALTLQGNRADTPAVDVGDAEVGESAVLTMNVAVDQLFGVTAPLVSAGDEQYVTDLSTGGAAVTADDITDIVAAVWTGGTRTLTANPGLTAADVRAAVGLAAANMDTQFAAVPTAAAVADKILGRSLAGGADGGRTVGQALAALRNKIGVVGSTVTVYSTDDVTPLWTLTLTRGSVALGPITSLDPAG